MDRMTVAKTFFLWIAGIAMSGVFFAFVQIGLFFNQASETTARIELAVHQTLKVLRLTGQQAQATVAATEPVLKQATVTLQQVGPAIKEVKAIRQDIEPILTAARKTVEQVGLIRNDLKPVIANLVETTDNANIITRDFSQTSLLMFNCKESPRTCIAPRVAGTLRAWEVTSGDLSKTMRLAPMFVATAQETNSHFAGIAKDVHLTADRLTAPKTVRQKIWEGVKLGVYAGTRVIGQ